MTTFNAVRTWNPKHTKATVVVTDAEGNEVCRAGGNRAGRAAVVILTDFDGTKGPGLYGLRGDAHAGQVEVEKMLRGGTRSHRGWKYEVQPYAFALAVPVTEAIVLERCKHCGKVLHRETFDGQDFLVDDETGGDVCGWDGGNEPHEV